MAANRGPGSWTPHHSQTPHGSLSHGPTRAAAQGQVSPGRGPSGGSFLFIFVRVKVLYPFLLPEVLLPKAPERWVWPGATPPQRRGWWGNRDCPSLRPPPGVARRGGHWCRTRVCAGLWQPQPLAARAWAYFSPEPGSLPGLVLWLSTQAGSVSRAQQGKGQGGGHSPQEGLGHRSAPPQPSIQTCPPQRWLRVATDSQASRAFPLFIRQLCAEPCVLNTQNLSPDTQRCHEMEAVAWHFFDRSRQRPWTVHTALGP